MPVDPVSGTLVRAILKESQNEDEKQRKSGYWMLCPSCGRRVVKKLLIKKGCYLCRWKGIEEEIKKAQAKQMIQLSQSKQTALLAATESIHSFRTNCPECGRQVISEEFKEKGCYICGWKPR